METISTESMALKIARSADAKGVSSFIKEQLKAIPSGQGLAMSDLAKEINSHFGITKQQAYVRINNALKGKIGGDFQRFEQSGYTYLSPKPAQSENSVEGDTLIDSPADA
jgi:hypothetical protein